MPHQKATSPTQTRKSSRKNTAPEDGAWEIRSYQGVGPLEFGMSTKDVAKILGKPESVDDVPLLGWVTEERPGIACYYDQKGKNLYRVDLKKQVPVLFQGKDIFKDPDPLSGMRKLDPKAKEVGHLVNLPKLGIIMNGFGKKRSPDGKIVSPYGKSWIKDADEWLTI